MGNKIVILGRQSLEWALQEKHKAKAREIATRIKSFFIAHPEDTGETYIEHLAFTIKMSARFTITSFIILLHGIFPFLCVRTGSRQIEEIYRVMKTRIPTKRREEIDNEAKAPAKKHIAISGDARVAIVGGGFSGAMVLANLIKKAEGNLAVEWFSPSPTLGLGVAYGTKDNSHLLNVRADRMGAFSGDVEHFYKWLQSSEGKESLKKIWPGRDISSETYVPRMVYGEYISHIVKLSLEIARNKNIRVNIHDSYAIDAEIKDEDSGKILLKAENGEEFIVDAMALATGNLPPKDFGFKKSLLTNKADYVEDVWNANDDVFANRVREFSPESEIVIIGTGLTMIDAVLTLRSHGYKGKIIAISRNGWLPAPHVHGKSYPAWDMVLAPEFAPRTALGILVRIKNEVKRASEEGYDWRSIIDSIRPVTQQLWKQLSIKEKRRFLSRLFTLWNIHRHRMAPEIHAELMAQKQSGLLKIIAGKIYYVGGDDKGLMVAYRKRGTNKIETLRPALMLNCTGPELDIAASENKLLKNLRDRGLISVGPLRIGIEESKLAAAIFPVGNLLVGELLECTAVPELRDIADQTAIKVLNHLQFVYEDDHQAKYAAGAWI